MLDLVLWPDPILRKRAKIVTVFGASLTDLANNMIATMIAHDGIGLAAPQVGVRKRLFVMKEYGAIVNPEITFKEMDSSINTLEGCLSFPGVRIPVTRCYAIKVWYQDTTGKEYEKDLLGIDSICFQHELDHLDGKTFLDYVSQFKRTMIENKLKGKQ